MKSVSIIIPSHHSQGTVLEAVQSCIDQDFRDFEVIVALNQYDDPSRHALIKFPSVKIVIADSVGVNRARNAGARVAKGEILFFMDDDCRMKSPDFLKALVRAFDERPEVSILGGPYLDPPRAPHVLRSYHAMTRLWIEAGSRGRNLLGGNLAVTRAAFGQGFRDEIVTGGDETEFLRRAEHAGKKIAFVPELELEHQGSRSWRHACIRAWNQNHARGLHGLDSKRGSFLRIFAQRRTLMKAWPYLVLHLGVGNLAAIAGRARRTLDPQRKGL